MLAELELFAATVAPLIICVAVLLSAIFLPHVFLIIVFVIAISTDSPSEYGLFSLKTCLRSRVPPEAAFNIPSSLMITEPVNAKR